METFKVHVRKDAGKTEDYDLRIRGKMFM